MSDTARRGPYAKGIAKREQILREALAAYAESDSSGPSLRSIAERVGLSERGLLHYFDSKDDLFVSILAERDAADRALFTRDSPLADLAAVQAHSSETPGLVRLFLEMAVASPDRGHPAHEYFTLRYQQLRRILARMIVRGHRNGERGASSGAVAVVPGVDAAFAARMLVAASDGLQLQWLLDPTIDLQGDLQRLGEVLQAVVVPSDSPV